MKIHNVVFAEENDELILERVYSITTDSRLSLTAHPHPLNVTDVQDLDVEVPEQFEERIDVLMSSIESPNLTKLDHVCGTYKATVPIARMQEILDIDNTEEFAYYRCSECSKCIRCKTSTRRHAISLQESVEQELIESSVSVDYLNWKVIVTYPWTKDPVRVPLQKA